MVSPNVSPSTVPSMVAVRIGEADAGTYGFDSEGPASAPTVLVEVDDGITMPTALPAPPRLPTIGAADTWHPPPPSRTPVIRPALALVRPAFRISTRPAARALEASGRTRAPKLRLVGRPSRPPTVPPPSPGMRRAA